MWVWYQLKFAISCSFYSHEPMSHKFTFKLYENFVVTLYMYILPISKFWCFMKWSSLEVLPVYIIDKWFQTLEWSKNVFKEISSLKGLLCDFDIVDWKLTPSSSRLMSLPFFIIILIAMITTPIIGRMIWLRKTINQAGYSVSWSGVSLKKK